MADDDKISACVFNHFRRNFPSVSTSIFIKNILCSKSHISFPINSFESLNKYIRGAHNYFHAFYLLDGFFNTFKYLPRFFERSRIHFPVGYYYFYFRHDASIAKKRQADSVPPKNLLHLSPAQNRVAARWPG